MTQGTSARTLLVLVAGNDYVIAGVNVLAALLSYVVKIRNKLQDRRTDGGEDALLYIKIGAKGMQMLLMTLNIGFSVITPGSDVVEMLEDVSMFQMTLIFLQGYGSIYVPMQDIMEEIKGKRRIKAMKSLLRKASREEIDRLEDACAICLVDMDTAVVTPCGHLYHAECLQRWLVTKNSCPKCSVKVLDESL
mmetsp:Transcript_15760/g.24504  ORF Transcript_15760/g.24504 Transcript_15760/m.24504 type:complete len:192 (+) Transcript_15760:144-719(+)